MHSCALLFGLLSVVDSIDVAPQFFSQQVVIIEFLFAALEHLSTLDENCHEINHTIHSGHSWTLFTYKSQSELYVTT